MGLEMIFLLTNILQHCVKLKKNTIIIYGFTISIEHTKIKKIHHY
jgi:hypothetical protein